MKKTLWFDMDGTLADTLRARPFWTLSDEEWVETVRTARGMVNLSALARLLRKAQRNGYEVGIVSWLPKSETLREETVNAKREWLARHLPSVKWDAVDIIRNGAPKWEGREGFLFDDNKKNRHDWNKHNGEGTAYNYDEILGVLRRI